MSSGYLSLVRTQGLHLTRLWNSCHMGASPPTSILAVLSGEAAYRPAGVRARWEGAIARGHRLTRFSCQLMTRTLSRWWTASEARGLRRRRVRDQRIAHLTELYSTLLLLHARIKPYCSRIQAYTCPAACSSAGGLEPPGRSAVLGVRVRCLVAPLSFMAIAAPRSRTERTDEPTALCQRRAREDAVHQGTNWFREPFGARRSRGRPFCKVDFRRASSNCTRTHIASQSIYFVQASGTPRSSSHSQAFLELPQALGVAVVYAETDRVANRCARCLSTDTIFLVGCGNERVCFLIPEPPATLLVGLPRGQLAN
ncbi:hypothetical protein C8Q79DRAFT_496065 [Trametes meyenii]|nr:hypothetical protein C8Q79DRAFT_496065 [Trametes meyenii]